jgi:hypothetical protein
MTIWVFFLCGISLSIAQTSTQAPEVTLPPNCLCLQSGAARGTAVWCGCCAKNCLGVLAGCITEGFCSSVCLSDTFCLNRTTTGTLAPSTSTSTSTSTSQPSLSTSTTTSSIPTTSIASTTTTMLTTTITYTPGVIVLRNNSQVVRSFDNGDVVVQIPGSAFEAGVRQLIVKTASAPEAIDAPSVVRPFSQFVSLAPVPSGIAIGSEPIVLCLLTALGSDSDELCLATPAGSKWNCTAAVLFSDRELKCARIRSLPGAQTFSFLAIADVLAGTTVATTLATTTRTPVATTPATVSKVCKVGEMEGGVLCVLNEDVKSVWDSFLALGDAVVGVVIAAIVLCILCYCGLILFLWFRPQGERDDAESATPPAPQRALDKSDTMMKVLQDSERAPRVKHERAPKKKIVRRTSSSSSSSSDNYEKFVRAEQQSSSPESSDDVSPIVAHRIDDRTSEEEEPSEQVVVFQHVEVSTPVAKEATTVPKRKKKKKASTKKKAAKEQSYSLSSESSKSSGSN